jgi:hypothetical protein
LPAGDIAGDVKIDQAAEQGWAPATGEGQV